MTSLVPARTETADLREVEQRVLWLATAMIDHANRVRPNNSGLKVGGHQASCASMVSIMTALYFEHLTAADVLLSFGLITGREKVASLGDWGGRAPRDLFPKLYAYIDRLETHPGYKRSVQKVKEIDESLGIHFQL